MLNRTRTLTIAKSSFYALPALWFLQIRVKCWILSYDPWYFAFILIICCLKQRLTRLCWLICHDIDVLPRASDRLLPSSYHSIFQFLTSLENIPIFMARVDSFVLTTFTRWCHPAQQPANYLRVFCPSARWTLGKYSQLSPAENVCEFPNFTSRAVFSCLF